MADSGAIDDYATGLLLRYFRSGGRIDVDAPKVDHGRDVHLLHLLWAVSNAVCELADYVHAHPHETQALLAFRPRVDDALARGRIDARQTVMHRLRTGQATALVAYEPVRTFDSGPNHVLGWVIDHAVRFVHRLLHSQAPGSAYGGLAADVAHRLNRLRRIEAIRASQKSAAITRRPSAGDVLSAARSRRPVYQLAVAAFHLLRHAEQGDEHAINEILRATLMGPLEPWRRFELAVCLGLVEALCELTGEPARLAFIASGTHEPVATVGPFAIYWQQATSYYSHPLPEPSEKIVRDILSAYGLTLGSDRPDLVIVDNERAEIAAIVEAKYLAGDTATTRFREAVEQVVRYARGYGTPTEPLLGRSLVALSNGAPLPAASTSVPSAVDFEGIMQGRLAAWATRLRP